jgi:hypothetical protein
MLESGGERWTETGTVGTEILAAPRPVPETASAAPPALLAARTSLGRRTHTGEEHCPEALGRKSPSPLRVVRGKGLEAESGESRTGLGGLPEGFRIRHERPQARPGPADRGFRRMNQAHAVPEKEAVPPRRWVAGHGIKPGGLQVQEKLPEAREIEPQAGRGRLRSRPVQVHAAAPAAALPAHEADEGRGGTHAGSPGVRRFSLCSTVGHQGGLAFRAARPDHGPASRPDCEARRGARKTAGGTARMDGGPASSQDREARRGARKTAGTANLDGGPASSPDCEAGRGARKTAGTARMDASPASSPDREARRGTEDSRDGPSGGQLGADRPKQQKGRGPNESRDGQSGRRPGCQEEQPRRRPGDSRDGPPCLRPGLAHGRRKPVTAYALPGRPGGQGKPVGPLPSAGSGVPGRGPAFLRPTTSWPGTSACRCSAPRHRTC